MRELVSAEFSGLTELRIKAAGDITGIAAEDIKIRKSNGQFVGVLGIKRAKSDDELIVALSNRAFEPQYHTGLKYDAEETFSEGAAVRLKGGGQFVPIRGMGVDISVLGDKFIGGTKARNTADDVNAWLRLNPSFRLNSKLDGNGYPAQIGVIKASMIVIDDPSAKWDENEGIIHTGANAGTDRLNRVDGRVLKTARDYYDYFVPDAKSFLRESSYGLCDIDVTLVESAAEGGVYRLSGKNADSYPARRGGDGNTYILEALELAKEDLVKAGEDFNVIYVVATENFEAISYGPTDCDDHLSASVGLKGYGALVRIGADSYLRFKKKAFIHELGHDLGLPDLYTSGTYCYQDAFSGNVDIVPCHGDWGMMGSINSPCHDFSCYEKWQMGWIRNDQVCILDKPGTADMELVALESAGGSKMIFMPGERKGVAYAVEYRRKTGVEVAPIKESSKPEFVYEGVYIYKIQAENGQMRNPLTTVCMNPLETPQAQTMPMLDYLARSVLGEKSGLYEYRDGAAGIRVSIGKESLNEDPSKPVRVRVERFEPDEVTAMPVISGAHFLDLDCIEFKTSCDLRGILHEHVSVTGFERKYRGVTICHITPGTVRVQ